MQPQNFYIRWREVLWNAMELLVSSISAHFKFHIISWNCCCQRNWRTPSSMEFHGTAHVIKIGAPQVPRNSVALLVSSELAHYKFHGIYGIPWNCLCPRNRCTPNSMKFHEIPWNCSCHRNWRTSSSTPWNSRELLVSSKLAHPKLHEITRNFMKLFMTAQLVHSKFHVIPISFYMSLSPTYVLLSIFVLYHMNFRHYTLCIKIAFQISVQCSLKLILIENSMEYSPELHGTFWTTLERHGTWATKHQIPWNSMEFCTDPKFHGIPWNFSHTPDFHWTPWNSTDFFRKMFIRILWNFFWSSMEFHIIPWNLINLIFKKIMFPIIVSIWLKSGSNSTYCVDFNIVIHIWTLQCRSSKMAQGQRKCPTVVWVLIISSSFWYILFLSIYFTKKPTIGEIHVQYTNNINTTWYMQQHN